MFNAMVYCALVLFALLGVVAFIYLLVLLFSRPRACGHFVVVIPPMSTAGEVASLICAARLRMGLLGDIAQNEVVALDCGLSEGSRKQCDAMCRRLDHVSLQTPAEFLSAIEQISAE